MLTPVNYSVLSLFVLSMDHWVSIAMHVTVSYRIGILWIYDAEICELPCKTLDGSMWKLQGFEQ